MKLKTLSSLTVIGALLLSSLPSIHAGEIKERQQNQQERIANGIESGELTPAEAARLEAREAELNKQIAEDRGANGKLTHAERKQIKKELKQISKRIHHAKHNRRDTTPAK